MNSIIKFSIAAVLAFSVGCNSQPESKNDEAAVSLPATGPQFIADSEPTGAVPVGQARADVEDGEALVVVGHIGGSVEPFIDGLAAFTIVDPKVPYCHVDEGCPTPWDYCCTQNQVKDNIATVKIVDEQGKPVAADARKLLAVKELALVVVQGRAQRDDHGNLSILADQVFIRSTN